MREFGQLEGAIMDVIWSGNRPYSVREVRERMESGRLRRAVFSVTADRAAS